MFCKDTMVSKDFYEKVLGFEVMEIQHGKFIWMKLGSHTILLRPGTDDGTEKYSKGFNEYKNSGRALVLYTKDHKHAREELLARGLEFKGTDGSDDCLTFTDPDGNWFQLVDPDHA